jgi:hypothetical protein
MSRAADAINPEPCADCPIPPDFVISALPPKEGECARYGVECRECGDKWIEIVDE